MLAGALTVVVALISGAVALLIGGVIANACVAWYHIPSREGASGFFVVFIALGCGLGGFLLSLIASRIYAASYESSFFKELCLSFGLLLLIGATSAMLCRFLADVPPVIDGRELILEVEFRFPNTLPADQPPTATGDWQVTLASLSGATKRETIDGEIVTASARYEQSQWIVPTRTSLFTERGRRLVTLSPAGTHHTGPALVTSFLLPLPARPNRQYEQWSDWLPRQQANGQPWPVDQMSCRFRVQQVTSPFDLDPR